MSLPAASPSRLGARHLTAVLLFFTATSVFYTYPLLPRLSTAILPGAGDYQSEAALIAWNARHALHPGRLYDSWFFYPYGETLAYWQSVYVPGLLAALPLALSGQPLLATNVVVLAAMIGSGVLTYGLAWSLTGRVLPSLLAGVVFAHFPNRLDHLGTPMVQMAFPLPVILWAFARYLETAGWRPLAVLVTALWAQMLSSLYYGFAVAFLLAGLLLTWALQRPRALSWALLLRGVAGLLVLVAALVPFLAPYRAVHAELGFARDLDVADAFGMDLLALFDLGAQTFNRVYAGRLLGLPSSEGGLFPGVVVLGLVGALVAGLWREPAEGECVPGLRRAVLAGGVTCGLAVLALPLAGRIRLGVAGHRLLDLRHLTLPVALLPVLALAWVVADGRRRERGGLTAHEWGVTLVALAVLGYLMTLSPTLRMGGRPVGTGLFHWIHALVPGAGAFRAPGRWAMGFALPLALLAALGLARVERSAWRGRRVLSGLLLAGVIVEYTTAPIPWSTLPPLAPHYRWLGDQPGDFAIAELPAQDGRLAAWSMFWSLFHGKRLIAGAHSFVPPGLDAIAMDEEQADPAALVADLRAIFPLRHVLVHHGGVKTGEESWRRWPEAPPPGLTLVRTFPRADVYEVRATPETGVDLHRYASRDYLARHPVAEMSLRLAGSGADDGEVRRWIDVAFNERPLARVAGGPQAISLPPPYRAADRNDLRLTHRYEVPAPVAAGDAYRIGQTGVHAPVDLAVRSVGGSGGDASIRVNGLEVPLVVRRGYNVAALDGRSGALLWADTFDTFRSAAESRRLAASVGALADGTIVAAAVKVDGGGQLEGDGVPALGALGSRVDLQQSLFVSHALIGVKGARPGQAVERSGPGELTVEVGKARGLALVLETFALTARP